MRTVDVRDIAKARDKWLATEQGQACQECGILLSENLARTLQNRLEQAFIAGAHWGLRKAGGKAVRKEAKT